MFGGPNFNGGTSDPCRNPGFPCIYNISLIKLYFTSIKYKKNGDGVGGGCEVEVGGETMDVAPRGCVLPHVLLLRILPCVS